MSLSTDCDRGHGFRVRSEGRTAWISTPPELNGWNAQELWEVIASACDRHRVVVVDLSATRVCKASAILSLETARKWAERCGCRLLIRPGRNAAIRLAIPAQGRSRRLRPAGDDA